MDFLTSMAVSLADNFEEAGDATDEAAVFEVSVEVDHPTELGSVEVVVDIVHEDDEDRLRREQEQEEQELRHEPQTYEQAISPVKKMPPRPRDWLAISREQSTPKKKGDQVLPDEQSVDSDYEEDARRSEIIIELESNEPDYRQVEPDRQVQVEWEVASALTNPSGPYDGYYDDDGRISWDPFCRSGSSAVDCSNNNVVECGDFVALDDHITFDEDAACIEHAERDDDQYRAHLKSTFSARNVVIAHKNYPVDVFGGFGDVHLHQHHEATTKPEQQHHRVEEEEEEEEAATKPAAPSPEQQHRRVVVEEPEEEKSPSKYPAPQQQPEEEKSPIIVRVVEPEEEKSPIVVLSASRAI